MISAVIFSKNRAAQLDLLLRSLQKNARHFVSDIRCLYTCDEDYEKSYGTLMEEWGDLVSFTKQANFSEDVKAISNVDTRLMCYFTDDDIVYRKVQVTNKELHNLFEDMDVGCLSLRLGRNTVIQDPINKIQTNCPEYMANYDNKFLVWNKYMIQGNSNYNYNLSVDGHIFRTKVINNLIKGINAEHPNDFEGKLQGYANLVSPIMSSLEQSCVVNAPVNKVNDKIGNSFGTFYPQSQEDLNKAYLEGRRIKLDKIDFVNILGTHQELVLPI